MGDYYGSSEVNNYSNTIPSNKEVIYEGKTPQEQISELKRLSAEATEKAKNDKLELEEANRKEEEIKKLEIDEAEIEREEKELRQMEEDKHKIDDEIARKKEKLRKDKENFNKNIKAAFFWFMKTSGSILASGVKTGYKYLIKDRFKLGGAKKSKTQKRNKTKTHKKRQIKTHKKRH